MAFQSISNTNPKIVVNLSRIQDEATRDTIAALLRVIQEMQNTIAKTVNNNADQGQAAVTVTFSNLAGVGSRTVKADANGLLSAP